MYFLDKKRNIDTSIVYKTSNFDYPIQKDKKGNYKLRGGMQLYVGLSTDFFVEEADLWRDEAWKIINKRKDIAFRILTKRAGRIEKCLPNDWGEGYENVMISVTTENQIRADERLEILMNLPAKHKGFMAAPLIGEVDAEKYLSTGKIDEVLCGGENYDGARPCHFEWVKLLSDQCKRYNVTFDFIETGTIFVKDGKFYTIKDKRTQSKQAFLSGLSYKGKDIGFRLVELEPSIFRQDTLTNNNQYYKEHCETCGSKLTCNGCSKCGACNMK